MTTKTIIAGVIAFCLIVAGLFAFTYVQKNKVAQQVPVVATSTTPTSNTYGITRIDGKHFFINGVHTIVGELSMPTPCDLLTGESMVAESYPEQVTFVFSVVNTTENCIQTQTVQRFKVSAQASKEAVLRATFFGQPVELNLVEAAQGETPEDFELFIKG